MISRLKPLNVPLRLGALMLFKILGAGLVLSVVSCGNTKPIDSEDYSVGRRPEFYSAAYLWRGGDQNSVVAISKEGMTLQRFGLEPFTHQLSLPLPLAYEKQGVASSFDGAYYLTMAENEYAILKSNGDSVKNPLQMLGKLSSVAFDPVHHLAVLSDEFQTMVLLVFSSSGDVIASWKAGSKFPGDKVVRSGTMMLDGRLVLALGETTIGVVDVPGSISAQSWVFTTFEVAGATDMKWITTVPDQPDIVMIIDKNRALSINIATSAIVAEKDLSSGTVMGYFRDYVPHVVTRSSVTSDSLHDVTYVGAGGQLVSSSIRGADHQITQSMLSSDGILTLVYDPDRPWSNYQRSEEYYRKQEVYRFRLADNAGLDKTIVDENVNLAMTPNSLFLLYPTALGKAVRRSFGPTPNDQVLEGYNLDLFRKGYRKVQ